MKLDAIEAVGVGVPGPVNVRLGAVARMPNVPGWEQSFELGTVLSSALQRPVYVDNDVNLGTLGEVVYGAGKGVDDLVGIFVGTGIGGGIVLGGRLRRGARWAAGEIGHMVLDIHGPMCGCGMPGHAEAVCSRGAITRQLNEAIAAGEQTVLTEEGRLITSGAIRRALDAHDALTTRVVSEAQEALGMLVASVVNLLDPQRIIMGGGLVESLGEPFLEPVRRAAYAHFLQKENAEQVGIVAAALGDDAVVLGGAVLARQKEQRA